MLRDTLVNTLIPLLETAVQFLSVVLLALAPIVALWVRSYLKNKVGLSLLEADFNRLLESIDEGIQLAEEESLAAIKRNLPVPNSATKESRAVSYILKTIEEERLEQRSAEWIKLKVRSRLADLGTGASASASANGQTAPAVPALAPTTGSEE